MWSSDRRTLLLGLAALAGCGFRPVYGPGGAAEGLLGTISVAAPSETHAYDLVQRLEQRLGAATAPLYELGYRIETNAIGVGITPEQETTRYNVTGTVSFTLTEIGTGTVATSGKVDSFTSYAATGSTVSTLAATQDAHRRLMVVLADQIVTRLQVTAGDWR
jgi:LPS-assembly lipoprotein